MKMPSGVNATLMPAAASGAPSQPFSAEQGGQRDAGNRRRQREGHVDDGIEQPPSGEAVAHQRPDDDAAHHQIDAGRRKREPEGHAKRVQGTAAGDDGPELFQAQLQ
ncbi:hypothetical protein ACVWZZ_005441 [Bradyrhizobium sp. LM6.10]